MMLKLKHPVVRAVGVLGTAFCIAVFVREPSFPTPDKLFIFLLFVFMAFDQALAYSKKFLPFIAVLLAYESFRSVADQLNTHVDYYLAPDADKWLFGNLPTATLQGWWWHGHVQWYDFAFYLAYMMHFILPIGLAILIWKTREKYYWRFINTYLVTAFAAFITFLLFPAAPPWMAAQDHIIQPITRISSDVWWSLGLHNFPSFYNHITPNEVAAVPSLHAAWATLAFIFVYKLYGWRWAAGAALYPFLIYVGTVYEGEHYAFDEITGILYALAAYKATPYAMSAGLRLWGRIKSRYPSSTRTALESKR